MHIFLSRINEKLNQTLVKKIRYKTNQKGKKVVWPIMVLKYVNKYKGTEYPLTGFVPRYLLISRDVTVLLN